MLRIDCGPSRNHYLLLEWTRELAFLKRPLAHPATVKIKLSITKHQLQANTQGIPAAKFDIKPVIIP